MPADPYLHDRPDFSDLIRVVAGERKLLPALVEKDYWIMRCLYGLGAVFVNIVVASTYAA